MPLFVMISGYLFFSKEEFDIATYYKKNCRRILLPTIVAVVFYSLLTALQEKLFSIGVDWKRIAFKALSGDAYSHLWYMYMIIGLYAVAPLFMYIKKKVNIRKLIFIGIGFIFIGILSAVLFDLPWPLLFIQYLGYFIFGYCLKEKNRKCKSNIWMPLTSGLLMVFAFGVSVIQKQLHFHENIQVYKYLSPIAIVASVILFFYLTSYEWKLKEKSRCFISQLSRANLTIYLVHQFYIDILYHWLLREKAVVLFPADTSLYIYNNQM